MPLKKLSRQILIKIKSLTDKPFGVNIMLLSPFVEDIVDLVIEEEVKVVTTGARKSKQNTWNASMKLVLRLFLLYRVLP